MIFGSFGPFGGKSIVATIGMQAIEENWPVHPRDELRGHLEGVLRINCVSLVKIGLTSELIQWVHWSVFFNSLHPNGGHYIALLKSEKSPKMGALVSFIQ